MAQDDNLLDKYQLLNCVSTGTHTQIWEVMEQGGSSPMAIKLLLPEAFSDREQKRVLKHEAKVAGALEHPNLIRFREIVMSKQHGYMVMDLFRAPNLKLQLNNDPTEIHHRLRKLVESLCLVIGYMHDKGWLHRDIKPDNILFNKSSEMRLIDYSLAMRFGGLSKMSLSKLRRIQGTRTYIAPETILKRSPKPQTDMYSLGVTLFQILTGQSPFKGSSPDDLLKKHLSEKPPVPSDFNQNITPEMDKFVLRMLAKKTENRHKNMNQMLAEFRALQVFKEDTQQVAEREQAEQDQRQKRSLDEVHSLDSRADAMRSELIQTDPEFAAQAKAKPKKIRKVRPVAGQPVMPQQLPPGYQPVPQPPYPPYPPQPMPGMLHPPQMPPGYPGVPQPFPQGGPPMQQQPVPAQLVPPQAIPPQTVASQPQPTQLTQQPTQQPVQQQQPLQPPVPVAGEKDDDLPPLMEELPPVF